MVQLSKKVTNYEPMKWEEFIDRYVNNFEEFVFKYNNYKIELFYAPKAKGFICYLVVDKKVVLESEIYTSPNELLENFKIDGYLLKDIWYELEWR